MASSPETLSQIAVDAGQAKPIVERKEQESNDDVASQETHAHLEISHAARPYPTRHADQTHTAYACPYHPKSHKKPRRPPAGSEESIVIALRPYQPGEQNKHKDIKSECSKYQIIYHLPFIIDHWPLTIYSPKGG